MPTRIVGGDESVVDASGREGGTTAAPGVIVGEMGRVARRRQVVDKRSREYILKSGLAGGLAGCAVRVGYIPHILFLLHTRSLYFLYLYKLDKRLI